MERKTRWPVALLVVLAIGCGGETGREEEVPVGDVATEVDERAMEEITEAADEPGPGAAPPYATPAPAPVVPVPNPPGQETVAGALQPVGNSGVEGSMTAAEVPGGTLVTVSVTRAPAAGSYGVALQRGVCGSPGEPVAQLSLRVGANGVGTVADTIPVPATTVMNGQHVLAVQAPNAGPATPPVACAPIPLNR